MPTVLPNTSMPLYAVRSNVSFTPQRLVDLDDALRQRQHHAERVLGHRLRIAARLIDHQHAGLGAGLDVDGVVARAVAGDDQQLRTLRE